MNWFLEATATTVENCSQLYCVLYVAINFFDGFMMVKAYEFQEEV